MTLLGNSTGNDPTEWVQAITRRLAEETGRPATISTWNPEDEGYGPPTELSGEGKPIIVWNGSTSSEGAKYSLDHIENMAPGRPNLLVINHGHNLWDARRASTEMRHLVEWARGE